MRKAPDSRTAAAPLRAVAAAGYGAGVRLRNICFDAGVFRSARVSVPVISVGNLTAGGTGKTPLVESLARMLMGEGRRVGILSRGYGRETRGPVVVSDGSGPLVSSREGGDEPVELASALPGVVIVAAEKRTAGAAVAVNRLLADVLLLDDGFQHRWIARDLDIVAISARRDPASERLLPLGLLREPRRGLARAHLVVLTRADREEDLMRAAEGLRTWWKGPQAAGVHAPAGFTTVSGGTVRREDLPQGPALLFTGVADPDSVEESLRATEAVIAHHVRFPDHHRLTGADAERVVEEANRSGAAYLVTTRKDAARLSADGDVVERLAAGMPLVVLTMVFRWISGEEIVRTMLRRALVRAVAAE